MKLLGLISFMTYLVCVICQLECNSHKTCGECIGHEPERCVWCSQEAAMSGPRCLPKSYGLDNENWCEKTHILNPDYKLDFVNPLNFSSTVQFYPQLINIKARPGVVVNFTMSYKSAKDFPIDVYFIMDYSYTMGDHKKKLEKEAINIYEGLKKLTRNVRLGIGSFIEKPGLPYADVSIHTTYAFKNHLSLTDDMPNFIKTVKDSGFGGNYDSAEAGLDALMQAMTCVKEVGWRNGSRRIIVLATDSTYHSAGDGKLVGAVKPNDMQCHVKNNEYISESLIYDYPSVSQINKIATEGNFIIIFAALGIVKKEYEALAKQIVGAKYAELKHQSNIINIINIAYQDSVKRVVINSNKPRSIHLKVHQDCHEKTPVNCVSTPSKAIVEIPVSIKSLECPSAGVNSHTVTLNPVGLSDVLKVIFEVDCQCECERKSSKTKSKSCSDAGITQCGVCVCDENRGGDTCELNCSDKEARISYSKCIDSKISDKVCSKQGTCKCGKCECKPTFSGEFCQYSETACYVANGKLCAGHGKCIYGECVCQNGWTGAVCECPDNNNQCIEPFTEKVCSGRGDCLCGKCKCHNIGTTKVPYQGMFCDSCDDCDLKRCEELKNYAICNHMGDKEVCDSKFHQATGIDVKVAPKSEIMNDTDWLKATSCSTKFENGTLLIYKYKIDSETRRLLIQQEAEPPQKADYLLVIGSVIGGILIIGLLTAIFWKILIDIYDKREYKKFCDEANAQGFTTTQNPLYVQPTQSFVNPAFNNVRRNQ